MSGRVDGLRIERFFDDGTFPNSRLPLLFYEQALPSYASGPDQMEALFVENGWPPSWRASVFTYHHYHSTAHETLGVVAGSARLMLGGPEGQTFDVEPGDVIVIPAGVAHRRLDSSGDFLVVGCYPPGQTWDLLRGEGGERPRADQNIARVPLPGTDPVVGAGGPLAAHWRRVQ
ncbi:MAG: cupin domain-containing protein [Devosia sp.]|uniref:cupin domain-containing protein n=1 Tax=Devosia sp. TaxID=1871048 RepID=UPI001AD3EB94|nr:cupin domain-containing protein [Devosia sp.]MBN9311377.1 cupin domain-containing protein [Devosia sp.]MBN9316473.1 cupin domain-containing protein [Devosia sp.]